jgi:outer membrane protein TolC
MASQRKLLLRPLLLVSVLVQAALAPVLAQDSQTAIPPKTNEPAQHLAPLPRELPDSQKDNHPPPIPISLPAALQLALASNLDILQAREVLIQARARQLKSDVTILPNLNIAGSYNHHEGNIQKTEGNIIKANRDSMWVNFGPSVAFSTTEAIFGPLAARRVTASVSAGVRRVDNDTLLAVGEAYFAVLRARRRVARVNETLEHLLAEDANPLRGQSKGLLPMIRAFVEVGAREAFQADLERVRVEILRRQEERAGALMDLRVAQAELARLLELDPALPLEPIEDFRGPMELPGDLWSEQPLDELLLTALNNRPELAENRALVAAALARVRAARLRPVLPNFAFNYNWGDFGGSPDILAKGFGPSGEIRHFSTRTEFDGGIVWRLENLGLGNRAEQREQQSVYRRATQRQLQIEDQVVTQVVQTLEQVTGWRERVNVTRSALFDASGAPKGPVFRSMELNFQRIKGGEGRPLEALDSVRGLSDTLESYGQAVTDYERARFRLLIALGLPTQGLIDPAAMPLPGNGQCSCTSNTK